MALGGCAVSIASRPQPAADKNYLVEVKKSSKLFVQLEPKPALQLADVNLSSHTGAKPNVSGCYNSFRFI
jgi:hypothetical protein